jgi:hypothetical protein
VFGVVAMAMMKETAPIKLAHHPQAPASAATARAD